MTPPESLLLIFVTSFGVGFSGAVTPGPLLAFNILEVVRIGFWAGPLSIVGHSLLELLIVAALSIGVAAFLASPIPGFVIGTAGGLFLIWMGWGMARHPARHAPPDMADYMDSSGSSGGRSQTVLFGAVVTLSNPYWSLWWATIGLGYLVWARNMGQPGLVSFYVGHILADFAWYTAVAAALVTGRRLMSPFTYRVLIVICGLFLLAMGGWFIASGIGFITSASQ